MLDHIGISVTDYEKSKAFYRKALKPLGYELLKEVPKEQTGGVGACGFGVPPVHDFWIDGTGRIAPRLHVCFRARSRAAVDEFHKAATAAGGLDNGGPGLRPQYHPNYYGAFVLDPDGYKSRPFATSRRETPDMKRPAGSGGEARAELNKAGDRPGRRGAFRGSACVISTLRRNKPTKPD